MDETDKLSILRDILLTDEKEYADNIKERIAVLEQTINERYKLSEKVDPIVEDRLRQFTREIPDTLGPTITKALQTQIEESKDQVVEVLYPIMGKMIKKYIAQEMKILSERIGREVNASFSARGWKRRFKAWFSGVKEEDLLLSEMAAPPEVLQVMIIEKNSGILIGNYSRAQTIDQDMMSGMLTAIKSFVEDAFQQRGQNLELIQYEFYNIHIQSFLSHYIAIVISGNYNTAFKDKLQNVIFDFYENFMGLMIHHENLDQQSIAKELSYYFKNENL
ncbi:cell envelope biogenesis protein OmpA [Sungkyunkwania multivorans]|uniref:Cell envelope biogenesis protein OmpA n=1 Tax=Sungkyunkwania multivorans TaxID=1173618 RepID=A0ABW3CV64_9FLAO